MRQYDYLTAVNNPLNADKTIIAQYANSPVINSLINAFNEAIDMAGLIDSYYDDVYNILTCKTYGLDVWGRIVGVQRILKLPYQDFIGTTQGGYQTFGHGTFYNSLLNLTENYILSDEPYRLLILAKALMNISSSSVFDYNRLLTLLFPRGRCYTNDLGSMEMRLVFEFYLDPFELAIIKQSGVIQPPTGVKMSIIALNQTTALGTQQGHYGTLSHSNFYPGQS